MFVNVRALAAGSRGRHRRLAPRRSFSLLLLACVPCYAHAQNQLAPLPYNNPGLTVDLGVGLWAWPIPADVDGDGDFDLIVSCPDKPSNGVWFFENTDGPTNVHKMPNFQPAKRISSTTRYLMPSYRDGKLRLLSPGIEYLDFFATGTEHKKKLTVDPNFYQPRWDSPKGPGVRHRQWRYADYNGDGTSDLVVGIEDWSEYGWDDAYDANGNWTTGPLHGFVFVLINQGSDGQPNYAEPVQLSAAGEPIDVYGCPSPNLEDFDGDGDLDLLCGEFLDGFTYFENTGSSTEPVYAAGQRPRNPDGEVVRMELQMIVPVALDWDLDGDLDLIVGDEDGRVGLVENTGRFDSNHTPVFDDPVYFQQVADTLKSGALATPVVFDWDGDGDQDILSGNTAGFVEWFENLSGPGVELPSWNRPLRLHTAGDMRPFRIMAGDNGSIQGPAEAKWGYTTLGIADWDQDGLPDILLNSIWGKVLWLRNVGTREIPVLAEAQPIEVAWGSEQLAVGQRAPKPEWTWWSPEGDNLVTQWRTTPCPVDWDADGLMDLVMLDQQGFLSFFQRTRIDDRLVLLPPRRIFYPSTAAGLQDAEPLRLNDKTAGGSGRRKLCIVDWDQDGRLDLLVNSTNANVMRQVSQDGDRVYFEDLGPLFEQNIQGHSTSPTVADFNRDGVPDFLGGAEDGRFYYRVR